MYNKTAEQLLEETTFIVEATSQEQYWIWQEWSMESCHRVVKPENAIKEWKQINGWMIQIGKLDNRPCCISVQFVRIDGQLVMFWYQCSQVTDTLQAEAWLHKHFKGTWDEGSRIAWCDAANFHHCMFAIKEKNYESKRINRNIVN